MNILILNTQVPFCYGGAEVLAEDLELQLKAAGHTAEILKLPFKWYPQQTLVNSILASKLLDVSSANGVPVDKVIALKFPMWLVPHTDMSLWILHQHRSAYDLWDAGTSDLSAMPDGKVLRDLIRREDAQAIAQRDKVFTISGNVSRRLKHYSGIDSAVLYPPPRGLDSFYADSYGGYFFFPSRITAMKRQELVLRALALVPEPVKVVFAGEADTPAYFKQLKKLSRELGVEDKVEWRGRVTEAEKLALYAGSLMVIFPPVDEDYGYVTPEAMLSSKAVLTLADSGGSLEFIEDGDSGRVVPPDAESLATAMREVWNDRAGAEKMGAAARRRVESMDLSWEKVLGGLL